MQRKDLNFLTWCQHSHIFACDSFCQLNPGLILECRFFTVGDTKLNSSLSFVVVFGANKIPPPLFVEFWVRVECSGGKIKVMHTAFTDTAV